MKTKNNSSKDYAITIAPILMITTGLFGWAVRGQAGYGAVPGCVFAGLLWGITWYYFSKENKSQKSRRYSLGWSVLAFTLGIGISGMQGWGDIVSMIRGEIIVSNITQEVIPVSPGWGYFYMFLLGFHWAGTGALALAWTGSKKPLTKKLWTYRILAMGAGIGLLYGLLLIFPGLMLPKYGLLDGYDYSQFDKLPDLYGEIRAALIFSGAVLGGLGFELWRKDKMNSTTILIPSIITGLSWMFLITLWEVWVPPWAANKGISFNWWRCWESSGGGAIGLGFGITFMLNNKKLSSDYPEQRSQPYSTHPNAERIIGVYFALIFGLVYSIAQSIKGNLHILYPNISALDETQLGWLLPLLTIFLSAWFVIIYHNAKEPYRPNDGRDTTPYFGYAYIFVYIIMRELGLQVTFAPEYNFSEIAFFVYYIVLALIDLSLVLLFVRKRGKKPFQKLKNMISVYMKKGQKKNGSGKDERKKQKESIKDQASNSE